MRRVRRDVETMIPDQSDFWTGERRIETRQKVWAPLDRRSRVCVPGARVEREELLRPRASLSGRTKNPGEPGAFGECYSLESTPLRCSTGLQVPNLW
ncbi:MAG: hypothetical protein JWM55_1241 [Acidimicrobiaceae bacterium]|nr:hypothetical protein [Acidimicrobiaceae bacterium]